MLTSTRTKSTLVEQAVDMENGTSNKLGGGCAVPSVMALPAQSRLVVPVPGPREARQENWLYGNARRELRSCRGEELPGFCV